MHLTNLTRALSVTVALSAIVPAAHASTSLPKPNPAVRTFPTTAPVVTSNTYTSAPTNVSYIQPTWTVTGRIAGPTGANISGQTITLQRLVGTTWSTLATTKTSTAGTYSITSGLGYNQLRNGFAYRTIVTQNTGGTVAAPTHPMNRVLPSNSVRLTHSQATIALRAKGIEWKSSGNCSNRYNPTCTSFDTIRTGTIREMIREDEQSGCNILITGGTETGHATGTYSHWNGYKFDAAMTPCLTNFIYRNARKSSYLHYYRPSVMYYNETSHWDHVVDGPAPF